MADKLSIGALSPDAVYDALIKKGLTKSDAAVFVGEWLVGEFGSGQRSFNYVQTFDATKPDCAPQFVRSFVHRDWVDGEDTVQAGETTGEEGFNKRFHAIEKDLDALGKDSAKMFGCMAELRAELRNLLNEIRNEFNRINGLLDKKQGGGIGPITTIPGIVSTGSLLGTIKFNDKPMTLWQTTAGMIMLPVTDSINPKVLDNPRATNPGLFARFVETKPDVRGTFVGEVTKKGFLEKFGNEKLEDGTMVRDLIDILPGDAVFENLDKMVTDLVDREAAALRSTGGVDAAISGLGIDVSRQKPSDAPLDKFDAIPPDVRAALIRNGIDTVGKLSDAGPKKITTIVSEERIPGVSVGDAADWNARAKIIAKLR